MKVIIAEKLGKVRSALRLLIEQELGGQIVAEVSCAASLFENLSFSQPELLVLDWNLPGLEGSDRIARVRDLCPDLKVIAVCSQGSEREIEGANAIITKGDPPERVLAALHSSNTSRAEVPAGDLKEKENSKGGSQ